MILDTMFNVYICKDLTTQQLLCCLFGQLCKVAGLLQKNGHDDNGDQGREDEAGDHESLDDDKLWGRGGGDQEKMSPPVAERSFKKFPLPRRNSNLNTCNYFLLHLFLIISCRLWAFCLNLFLLAVGCRNSLWYLFYLQGLIKVLLINILLLLVLKTSWLNFDSFWLNVLKLHVFGL